MLIGANFLQREAKSQSTFEEIKEKFVSICVGFNVQTEPVCSGIFDVFGPELIPVVNITSYGKFEFIMYSVFMFFRQIICTIQVICIYCLHISRKYLTFYIQIFANFLFIYYRSSTLTRLEKNNFCMWVEQSFNIYLINGKCKL